MEEQLKEKEGNGDDLSSCRVYSNVEERLIVLRGQSVILDADVAEIYGVETKRVNGAVRNNPDKFPDDYLWVLSDEEIDDLRTKNSSTNFSVMSRKRPKAFTEKGLYMLATILKSNKAKEATFAIIETFAKVRRLKQGLLDIHKEADARRRKDKMQQFGKELSDIVMPDMETSETESTLELNFFIGKIKHTVRRIRKNKEEKGG